MKKYYEINVVYINKRKKSEKYEVTRIAKKYKEAEKIFNYWLTQNENFIISLIEIVFINKEKKQKLNSIYVVKESISG